MSVIDTMTLDQVEELLANRRKEWFGQWSAKELARMLGCEVRTAHGYKAGNNPGPAQVQGMVRVWGQTILDVLYGPLMDAPDLALIDRVERVALETAQIKRDLEEFYATLGMGRERIGAAPSDRVGTPGLDCGGGGVGAEPAVDGIDKSRNLDRRTGMARAGAALRALTVAGVFTLVAAAQMSGTLQAADIDLRRGPSGRLNIRPPVSRVLRNIREVSV